MADRAARTKKQVNADLDNITHVLSELIPELIDRLDRVETLMSRARDTEPVGPHPHEHPSRMVVGADRIRGHLLTDHGIRDVTGCSPLWRLARTHDEAHRLGYFEAPIPERTQEHEHPQPIGTVELLNRHVTALPPLGHGLTPEAMSDEEITAFHQRAHAEMMPQPLAALLASPITHDHPPDGIPTGPRLPDHLRKMHGLSTRDDLTTHEITELHVSLHHTLRQPAAMWSLPESQCPRCGTVGRIIGYALHRADKTHAASRYACRQWIEIDGNPDGDECGWRGWTIP